MRALVAAGGSVNAIQNDDGFSALTWASQNDCVAAVKALLELKADVNSAQLDDGFTSLHWASQNGHLEVFPPFFFSFFLLLFSFLFFFVK